MGKEKEEIVARRKLITLITNFVFRNQIMKFLVNC